MKIFRKIRQKLITNKNWREYLIYAIGEIILVVIGILIALQINNWNQRQILNKKEIAYIEEIRMSLIKDQKRIEDIIDFNTKKDSCITAGIKLLGTKMANSDRVLIFFDLVESSIGRYSAFRPNYVAFNNMISTESIGIIRNDSLRNLIAYYYGKEEYNMEKVQERMKEKTHGFIDFLLPNIVNKELAASLTESNLNFDYPSITDIEFHKNPKVFYELNILQVSIETQNQYLKERKLAIENILSLISSIE